MSRLQWRKLGLVWAPSGKEAWARSHAMGPTPVLDREGRLKVYFSSLDADGVGRPAWVELDRDDPRKVLGTCQGPLLEPGRPGTFDDNGVMVTGVLDAGADGLILYYAGFELGQKIRYRIFTGAARSRDGGVSFQRVSEAPLLDRTDGELFFRGGPFVLADQGAYRLWYVAGGSWTELNGKAMPVYELRSLAAPDPLGFGGSSILALALQHDDEHGFGRPWVLKVAEGDYRLFFSVRRRSLGAYRLGYARSTDGRVWVRDDDAMGLEPGPDGFDSKAIMYSAVIRCGPRTYCFYNGNEFGKDGFAVAELEGSL